MVHFSVVGICSNFSNSLEHLVRVLKTAVL
jgi:hypothetical protein